MSQRSKADRASARGSDAAFAAAVFIVALLVAAVATYAINRHPDSPIKVAGALPITHRAPTAHPIRHHHRTHPGKRTVIPGATRQGAVAVVERNFELGLAGRFAAACAQESPAYLASDARLFPNGGCVAGSRSAMELVTARGITVRLDSAVVTSYGGGRATVLTSLTGAGRTIDQRTFLQYRGGRWWITGDELSGDVGY